MKTTTPCNRFPYSASAGLIAFGFSLAFAFVASGAAAAAVNWTGNGGDNLWSNAANWSSGRVPWAEANGRDWAVIDGAAVLSNSSLNIQQAQDQRGINVLQVLNGGSLSVSGDLTVLNPTSTSGNVIIGAGSSLSVSGDIITGVNGTTNRFNSWTINGTVSAANFRGRPANPQPANPSRTGGYELFIDGGTMNITNTFSWIDNKAGNVAGISRLTIGNNGALVTASMSTDWLSWEQQTLTFVDGTGSLTFGKSGWDENTILNTLFGSHILLGEGVQGHLSLNDTGANWVVSVVVPEPATATLLLGIGALASVALLRRRKAAR